MKVIRVEFEHLNHFENGKFRVDFTATDRVFKNSELFKISRNVATHNLIGFIGLNATGKTTALRLLNIALNVTIHNADLNSLELNDMIVDGTIMRVTFFHNKKYYQLESTIGRRSDESKQQFYYKEEVLRKKLMSTVRSRSDLINFEGCTSVVRSKLSAEKAAYLDDDQSIVKPEIQDNGSFVSDNLFFNYVNIMGQIGDTPAQILELLDESIEELSMFNVSKTDKRFKWRLKFKNDDRIYEAPNPIALNLLISTGTISGQGLIISAINVLRHGGYLIVDEVEGHLNKELVHFILTLFKEQRTNPNGACIIFATHYVEILDFETLDRKDNIYIMRKQKHLLSATKLSDEFHRTDLKKSVVFFSNLLNGTAPKYESMKRLRDFICENLN